MAVGGRASDAGSGIASIRVNGVTAALEADGDFHLELPLASGVSLVEVVARDRAGNQTRDVRAVLSGPRSVESVLASGLMVRVAPDGYRLVAEVGRAPCWAYSATSGPNACGSGMPGKLCRAPVWAHGKPSARAVSTYGWNQVTASSSIEARTLTMKSSPSGRVNNQLLQ